MWLRWRRAGGENTVPRLIWIIFVILLMGAIVTGLWVTYASGGHKQAVAADNMAQKLWGQHTPGYTVNVHNGVGNAIQTGILGMDVTLTASSQRAFVGQSVTLTATATEDVSGYELAIFDQTTGQWIGQPVASGTRATATVSQTQAGSHTYIAYVGRPGGSADGAVSSQPVTVTWAEVSISVQATPSTNVLPGQHVTITGQVTSDGTAVSGQIVTLSANGGSLSTSQVATDQNGNFTATFTPNAQGTYMIMASCAGQTATATVQVRPAFVVTLQSNNTTPVVGQSVTLTATVNQNVAPYSLSILEQTTGQAVAGPISSGSSLSASVTQTAPGSHTYVAIVSGVAQSSLVTVTWTQPVVTINAPSTINEGQTVTIWGTVKSTTGAPLAGQRVSISVSAGTLNGGGLTATVTTDSNGNWSVSYTAPNQQGTVQVTATADGVTATQTFSVSAPLDIKVYYGSALPTPTPKFYFTIPSTVNNSWTLYLTIWNKPAWTYVYLYNQSTGQFIRVTPTMAANDNSCPDYCGGDSFGNTVPYTYVIPLTLTPGNWEFQDTGTGGYISEIWFKQNW